MIESVVALYFLIGFGAAFTHYVRCYNCWSNVKVFANMFFEFWINTISWPYALMTDLITIFKKPTPPMAAAFVSKPGETKEEFEARVRAEVEKMNG